MTGPEDAVFYSNRSNGSDPREAILCWFQCSVNDPWGADEKRQCNCPWDAGFFKTRTMDLPWYDNGTGLWNVAVTWDNVNEMECCSLMGKGQWSVSKVYCFLLVQGQWNKSIRC